MSKSGSARIIHLENRTYMKRLATTFLPPSDAGGWGGLGPASFRTTALTFQRAALLRDVGYVPHTFCKNKEFQWGCHPFCISALVYMNSQVWCAGGAGGTGDSGYVF